MNNIVMSRHGLSTTWTKASGTGKIDTMGIADWRYYIDNGV